jgi:uroporphyrin-III C-methyltransferase/precorrin-2 dehydrogenase/sirohydrochlorin ferrochelatase
VLVRRTRSLIEAALPHAYGRLADFAGDMRDVVKRALPDLGARRLFWESALDGPVAEMVMSGQDAQARQLLEQSLADASSATGGEVFLIGAGPGDPDLMTFRAARLLQAADVVLYDRLVTAPILEMARRDAERIYVGKRRDQHTVPQQDINQLLLDLAQKGLRVARLKGGDPFIFGRGGEEIELLAAHRIPFQVVPGITAASGCASYAGIPLTHRDHAQSVRFLTAHKRDGNVDLPWQDLTNASETLVFYMGLQGLSAICENLRQHGRDAQTPVALVEQGTTRQQRTFVGTLATMTEIVAGEDIHAPTLIIVGGVVQLRERLAWYGEATTGGLWPPES